MKKDLNAKTFSVFGFTFIPTFIVGFVFKIIQGAQKVK